MGLKSVESRVVGVGGRVKGIIRPLGVILPVAGPNVQALMSAGPRGLLDYNVNAVKSWRPPDWNTVTGYIDGPGGVAIMTGIAAKLGKWAIRELRFNGETGPLIMLVDCVEAWADGSAVGWGIKELVYPTISGVSAPFGGVSTAGLWGGSQPAKDSPAEMNTRDRKPKTRSMMM